MFPADESFSSRLLTPRQREVMQYVCEGKTNAEIGILLQCKEGTIKKHLQDVYHRLGVENRFAAIVLLLGLL